MTQATPGVVRSDFLLSEASGYRSRKEAVVTSSGTAIRAGQVMKSASRASATSLPLPGNVGNGAMGAITVTGPAKAGLYRLILTAAGATAAFNLYDPDGVAMTAGAVASAYSTGGLAFTLADGASDYAIGDEIRIVVDTNEFTYTPYAGSGTVAGVLYNDVPSVAGDYRAVIMIRDCEVMRMALTGLDSAAETALEALGIIVCGVYTDPGSSL